MRRVPQPSEEERRRRQILDTGAGLGGLEGSFWRLMKQADVENLHRWCQGERIRGVPPTQLFDALTMWLSSAVTIVAGQVPRRQMQDAARDILTNTAKLVHKDIAELGQRKKGDELLRRGLTLVK